LFLLKFNRRPENNKSDKQQYQNLKNRHS